MFYSNFATFIKDLIAQKRSLGYKYESQVGTFKRFDTFCITNYPNEKVLSKEIVLHWSTKLPNEKPATLQNRVTVVNELAKYLLRLDIYAFILPKGTLPTVQKHIPHIYTDEELRRIFEHIDNCKYCSQVPFRHLVMPVFFRVIYCCGMRLSEARLLKVKDVDLNNGVITINNAKFDKQRQIPVLDNLLYRLIEYFEKVHIFSSPDDWFFIGYKNKPMTSSNVEKNLYRFLRLAKIPRSGRNFRSNTKGSPNIHSFRHTFAVHCLRKWVIEEKDLKAYIPILQAYLGHVEFSDTAYYLHLTSELYPNITEKIQQSFGDIIPKVGVIIENN